jgi:hypothetical protein
MSGGIPESDGYGYFGAQAALIKASASRPDNFSFYFM